MASVFLAVSTATQYPVVLRWLMILLLTVAAAVWVTFVTLVSHDPTSAEEPMP